MGMKGRRREIEIAERIRVESISKLKTHPRGNQFKLKCVFVSRSTSLPNGGGDGGGGGSGEGAGSGVVVGRTNTQMMTNSREGVATWTTAPTVVENEQAVQSATISYNSGLDGGGQGRRLSNVTDSKSAAARELTAGEQEKQSEAVVHDNLYYPLYYGDAHIKVGHTFAITCILTRTEAVQWQRDGEVIQVQGRRRKRGVLTWRRWEREGEAEMWKEETFPMPIDNQINWDIGERPKSLTRTPSGGDSAGAQGRQRKGWMHWDGSFQQFVEEEDNEEVQMESRRKRQNNGAESVSSDDDDDQETPEWDGFADAGQQNDENGEEEEEEVESDWILWKDLNPTTVSAAVPAAGDGHLARQRLKRNVSELEQFKLRQYYNALVYYKNQPGGGGYYMDSFLKRDQQTRRAGEEEREEMEVTDEEESIHDYVFTQGQVQVVVHLHRAIAHYHHHHKDLISGEMRRRKSHLIHFKIEFHPPCRREKKWEHNYPQFNSN